MQRSCVMLYCSTVEYNSNYKYNPLKRNIPSYHCVSVSNQCFSIHHQTMVQVENKPDMLNSTSWNKNWLYIQNTDQSAWYFTWLQSFSIANYKPWIIYQHTLPDIQLRKWSAEWISLQPANQIATSGTLKKRLSFCTDQFTPKPQVVNSPFTRPQKKIYLYSHWLSAIEHLGTTHLHPNSGAAKT